MYCTSPDCASIQFYGEDYQTAENDTVSLEWKHGGLLTRVDRAIWDTGFENAYADFNSIPTLEDATIKTLYLSQQRKPIPSIHGIRGTFVGAKPIQTGTCPIWEP